MATNAPNTSRTPTISSEPNQIGLGLVLPRSLLADFESASLNLLGDQPMLPAVGADGVYVDDDGDVVATLRRLRQHATVRLDSVWLQLHTADPVEIKWIARIRQPDAVVEGILHLAVAQRPTSITARPASAGSGS
jgi:hypothetical protein